ncbi:DNA-binding protein [Weissella confusa]|uniref:DNA-binding protein n=1 Tax=Weissella confusa TaxID=1583 RepID=UPI00107F7C6B|nr:DNA-binding protein [Weissella confusa]MBJ7673294.1 helix-turn-helix domain-containing protein [Weissella confusa]MCT0014197.1 DNA-binding protein [Weissella confusa]MCT0023437.1 DNA-binding protein [Weissella confusa]TGE67627.1 DNA-binding protein [Weissella confusa]TGE71201.1 DNA-binding protein [Weissella confusa]
MQKEISTLPLLLTREQASNYLGIDPKSFDKYVRSSDDLKRFMVGKQERYTIHELEVFIIDHSIY